jgi:hypothetical protein
VNVRQFIDSRLDANEDREPEDQTLGSEFKPYGRGRGHLERKRTPATFREEGFQEIIGARGRIAAGSTPILAHAGALSPSLGLGMRGYGLGMDRGAMHGIPGRPAHRVPIAPQIQQAGYFAVNPVMPDQPYIPHVVPPYQHNLEVQYGGFGGVPTRPEPERDLKEGRTERLEQLERRMERLERQRNSKKARWAITSEIRRMQASISPTEHPGLYSQIDQHAAIHDCPPSHRGIMALTGACMVVIKNVDINVSYLADAEWEYGRRLCSEGGEDLTKEHVLKIEAKVLEFHAK